MDIKYTTTAISTGDGRNGHVASDDGQLDEDVRLPTEMGGSGGATNPEQLFAAGYAACFHQALKLAAGEEKVDASGSEVEAEVGLGPDGDSFAITVTLGVHIPGADQKKAEAVAARAHELCPYSKATRGNVTVDIGTTV